MTSEFGFKKENKQDLKNSYYKIKELLLHNYYINHLTFIFPFSLIQIY